MKRIKISMSLTALAFFLAVTWTTAHAQSEGEVIQTFTLKAGWNAIFLEVQPEPRDPATVFAGLTDMESAWTWLSRESAAEFIQNPSEGLWGQPGWHAYFPPGNTSFLTNLYAVLGNQAYLIKMSAESDWQVSGVPSMRKTRWLTDSFNMVGFHLDPNNPPTIAAYFTPSAAQAGQAVYRLNNLSGKWEFVQNPSATPLQSGAAYWVYSEGSSTYQGPLGVDLPMTDGLHFGNSLTRLTVTLSNLSAVTRTVTFAPSGNVVLYYREWDVTEGYFTWKPLGQMPAVAIQPGSSRNVWLEVRREQMATGLSKSVLEIADDKGDRIRVPVSAEKIE